MNAMAKLKPERNRRDPELLPREYPTDAITNVPFVHARSAYPSASARSHRSECRGARQATTKRTRQTGTTIASAATRNPRKEGTCHQPSAFSNAHPESHAARPSHTATADRSIQEVANPHQPRVLTSTTTVAAPAIAIANPATDGNSMRRQAGRGCSMRYDMLVT